MPPARVVTPRLWLAFTLLPFVNGLLGYLLFPALSRLADHRSQFADPHGAAVSIAILCAVLTVMVTLCGAIPVVFWLQRRGPITLGQTLAAGVLLGNAPFAFFALASLAFAVMHLLAGTLSDHLASAVDVIAGALRVVLLGSVLGSAAAALVWVIGVRNTALAR